MHNEEDKPSDSLDRHIESTQDDNARKSLFE